MPAPAGSRITSMNNRNMLARNTAAAGSANCRHRARRWPLIISASGSGVVSRSSSAALRRSAESVAQASEASQIFKTPPARIKMRMSAVASNGLRAKTLSTTSHSKATASSASQTTVRCIVDCAARHKNTLTASTSLRSAVPRTLLTFTSRRRGSLPAEESCHDRGTMRQARPSNDQA